MSREQDSVAAIVAEMRSVANNYGSSPPLERGASVEIAMWAERLDRLTCCSTGAAPMSRDSVMAEMAIALRALLESPREGQCGEDVRLACGESRLDAARIALWAYDALAREAAPQASGLPAEVLAWIEARREYRRLVEVHNARVKYARTQPFGEVDCNHEYQAMCAQQRVTRTATEAAGNALERLATTDSAIQSQQGATGGVVDCLALRPWSDFWASRGRTDVSHDFATFRLAEEWATACITAAHPQAADAQEMGYDETRAKTRGWRGDSE